MAARQYRNVTSPSSRAWIRGNFGTATGTIPNVNLEMMKPLSLIDGGFKLAADGEEIQGFLTSVNSALETGGLPYVSLQNKGEVIAVVVAGGTTVVVGDCVIAAANAALGTANATVSGDPVTGTLSCVPIVKKGTPAAGTKYWRVVDLREGGGLAGTLVTLFCE
jgi:hypothetical protein